MNRTTTAPIVLPFGPKPGWELEEGADNDKEGKRSISESCVLIQALRQSRDKWLYSTFPRFSSKVRGGKATDPAPPPHTIQTRGKCDLEIGPHVFPDTTFYEVHYLPSQPSSTLNNACQTPKTCTTLSQPSTVPASGAKSLEIARPSGPLASNLTSVATITPALINQVNAAASSNPTLANLLQLAAAGLATPDQLKTLGLLIQSLANSEVSRPVPPSLAATPALPQLSAVAPCSVITPPIAPVKDFDLVLEFRESPNDRWIFPRGVVTCERTTSLPAAKALCRAVIKTCLPFPNPAESESSSVSGPAGPLVGPAIVEPQAATFVLERTPLAIWDTISRWAGNQENLQQNKMKLDTMKPVDNVYLGYQLSEGSLMTQLQTASAPTYTMKNLKSATSTLTRAKRKVASKSKATAQQMHHSLDDTEAVKKPPPLKRKRAAHHSDRPAAIPIQCVSCKNQDVPLILGGRFCRPCVEAGHATTPTPFVQLSRVSSYNLPLSVPSIPPSTTETTSPSDTPK